MLHSVKPRLHDEFPLGLVEGVLLELEEVRAARGLVLIDGGAGGVDQHLGKEVDGFVDSSPRILIIIFRSFLSRIPGRRSQAEAFSGRGRWRRP